MKKLIASLFVATLALATFANDLFIFSADGVTQGSGKRLLPSQGVNQQTGQIVLNLMGQTDEVRGQCGWYRVLPNPEVATNEVFKCTNYLFSAGLATPQGEVKQKPHYKTVNVYSKLSLYVAACKLGAWENLKNYLASTTTEDGVNLLEAWNQAQDFNDNYPAFVNALSAVKAQLMLDDEAFAAILEQCKTGSYQIQIDEDGNEVPGTERTLRTPSARARR